MSGKFLLLLLVSVQVRLFAQAPHFKVLELSLPEEIRNPDNEFSGLYCTAQQLLLLSESRPNEEAKLYAFNLSDLDHKIKDSSFLLPYLKYPIQNLEPLKHRMHDQGMEYEGLEAILADRNTVWLSVETSTASAYACLLKGTLGKTSLLLDTQFLTAIRKPVRGDNEQIYNAGFESLALKDKDIITLFEFNGFSRGNNAAVFDKKPGKQINSIRLADAIPFRLTDISAGGHNHYTGINYFYKGAGRDAIYRPAADDTFNNRLVKTSSGYQNYCRLIDLEIKGDVIRWQSLWEFPEQYLGYNWEGIALYKKGYFIINDRYTPAKPYHTKLIYLAE
ncbi:MAG: hypothetical protein WC716_09020 [Chitinophagaceae bacterium]|jgi:hypothetical protein